jgi:hypothetical protein
VLCTRFIAWCLGRVCACVCEFLVFRGCNEGFLSSGIWRCFAGLAVSDVSKERVALFFKCWRSFLQSHSTTKAAFAWRLGGGYHSKYHGSKTPNWYGGLWLYQFLVLSLSEDCWSRVTSCTPIWQDYSAGYGSCATSISFFFPRRHVVRPGNYVRLCGICQDLSRLFVRGPARWKSASLLLLVLILRCRRLWDLRFLWRWQRFTALWDVMS